MTKQDEARCEAMLEELHEQMVGRLAQIEEMRKLLASITATCDRIIARSEQRERERAAARPR